MALTFTQQPSTTDIIPAYNNSIFEFTSALAGALYCDITNDQNTIPLRIYPDSTGKFWCNLKELFRSFFEIVDNVPISYGTPPNIFFKDNEAQKDIALTFTVHNATETDMATLNYSVMRYVLQDLEPNITDTLQFIGARVDDDNEAYYTHFLGYPFSIDFYSDISSTEGDYHTDGGDIEYITMEKGFNRLYFNIGDDELGNRAMSVYAGNKNFSISTDLDFINKISGVLKIINPCDGVYLKWLAPTGDWKYWLFNNKRKETISTKSIGQMDGDFKNNEENNTPIIELGKTAEKTTRLHATGLKAYELEYVKTIINSPKVFLFKGVPNTAASLSDFYEVELLTNSYISNNYGRNEFNFEIEIKERHNTIRIA